ncbi:DUF1573 domain-containing protein [uncultured Parabacteroides sp.]|uniref:DUF1573 domain-containing protein n=1 Tax=uncultured Parabacteroides sp. TaxID=512312 RepID=UPI0026193046|nr:DUF1573 domain-containing protein [uncultured Parabacteroides sp.]
MKSLLYILSLFFLLTACKENKKDQFIQLVQEWQGKEITFPKDMIFTKFVTDTINYKIPQSDYKVLIYVDSVGCTSCKLQLSKWKELIEYTDSITNGSIPYLFFFQSKDDKELHYLLKQDNFDHPVCIDHTNQLDNINKFPKDLTFQTFLLNKENKVVVIGNPVHNLAVKNLYLKQISDKEAPIKQLVKTTAKAVKSEFDLGVFTKTDIKTATFEILNTGECPLVIADVSTTCGCTGITYDKHPANPGDSLQVVVKMTPKEMGFFHETITVKCNTKQTIRLTIRGQVR